MLNVGPAEFLIIGLVLLIAVGPEQLPGVIRRVGSTVGQLRSMTDGLRSEFMAGMEELERSADLDQWRSAPSTSSSRPPATPSTTPPPTAPSSNGAAEPTTPPDADAAPEEPSDTRARPEVESEPESESEPAPESEPSTGPEGEG